MAALVGFTLLDPLGTGLYLLPFAGLALAVALWPPDAGPWAALFGGFVAILSAAGQMADALYVPRTESPGAAAEHLRLEPPWLAFMVAGGLVAIGSAFAWPRAWTNHLMAAAAATGWIAMSAPGAVEETRIFVLPGALLMTAGAARSWWVSRGPTEGLGMVPRGPPRVQKW